MDQRDGGALRIFLFGRFRVSRDTPVHGLESIKAQELLAYLLLNGERAQSRRTLAEFLWGDASSAQAHKYLRQALWQIVTALCKDGDSAQERLLIVENDWIATNARAAVWIDVRAFETALQNAPAGADGFESRRAAVELYQADLLEGWYQDWCLFERERLQSMYLSALDALIDDCQARQDWTAGLEYGHKVLRYDPARERTHRRLMRLHYLAGDRAAALRQYQRCAAALEAELSVVPSRPTMRLLAQIRADEIDAAVEPVSHTVSARTDDLVTNLERIRSTMGNLQVQLEREIARVGSMTNGMP